jgi:hypothetical protein
MGDLGEAFSKAGEGFVSLEAGRTANIVARHNAWIDEQDAEIAINTARKDAALEQRRGARIRAQQAVMFGQGGVQADAGSPLLLAAQEAVLANLRGSAELRIGAFEARRRKQSADMHRFRGTAAKRAGKIKFAGKLAEAGVLAQDSISNAFGIPTGTPTGGKSL